MNFDGTRFDSGNAVIVGSITYLADTAFYANPATISINNASPSIEQQVFNLAEAINAASGTRGTKHFKDQPNTAAYAKASGSLLILFGREPGVDFTATNSQGVSITTDTTGSSFTAPSGTATTVGSQLTAAGNGTSIDTSGFKNHSFYVTVASIDTNVVVRIEGSTDDSTFANIDVAGTDITYTANGTYLLSKAEFPMKYARVVFVSESGGTGVTLDTVYVGGN